MVYVAYSFAWISTAVGIAFAVYITQSAWPVWGFIFPTCIALSIKKT